MARLNAFMQEHLSAMPVVQLFNREEKARIELAQINAEYLKANLDTSLLLRHLYPLVNLIAAGGSAVIIWYGGGRLSTIQRVDKIVVLHKGTVRETGRHQDLRQQRGLYYKLYRLQYERLCGNQ